MQKGGVLLALVLVLLTYTDVTSGQETSCYECSNYDADGNKYDFCPMDATVDATKAFKAKCGGKCFTRKEADNRKMVRRGCTENIWGLPDPLPEDGCYEWKGEVFCVCTNYLCNAGPLGEATGVAIDAHIYDPDRPMEPGEQLLCFECVNWQDGQYYDQCPKNGSVDPPRTYSGPCNGTCFTRTDMDDPDYIARGCSTTQYVFEKMPPPGPGCYDYLGATWCICNTSYCNGPEIGVSDGTRLDAHISQVGDGFVEPDGKMRCYSCVAIDSEGVFAPQCPKNDYIMNAYLAECNGSCITRDSDSDPRQVGRGCSDVQGSLPDPLPPDGCYSWYTQTWCVCSTSRCNGAPIGRSNGIEFDAHIRFGGASYIHSSHTLLLISVLVSIITIILLPKS